ncbi:alpha/beta fold hydrolase [Blastococcus litoris]|uniref:alpha/beta fold hydrolase n=1 Tax=Blastococcus litoris TaxID=2171622 RepID=UPI0019D306AF|nr:alpha/beta hydrolase [Blastococcus litoris]
MLSRSASAPDAVVPYGPDGDQVADVRYARGPAAHRPVLVLLHGGFWRPSFDRLHLRSTTEALAAAGWTTVAPEYRRVPGRPDRTVADVAAAVRAVAGLPGLAGRAVLLAGHSAGGHLALHAAATLDVPAGVLALAPVADLRLAQDLRLDGDAVTAFLGEDAAARPDLDPAALPSPACAVRIVHGRDDGIVPVAVSGSYLRRHPAARLDRVDGGHFGVIDPLSGAWPAVLAALADLGA